jgi:hypothetical protein
MGGEAEYPADTDYLDDDWQPRIWEPLFGNQHWVAALHPFLEILPLEDVRLLRGTPGLVRSYESEMMFELDIAVENIRRASYNSKGGRRCGFAG